MKSGAKLVARPVWLAALVAPPALALTVWHTEVPRHPLLIALVVVLYDTCVLVAKFAAGVVSDLMARWQKRLADSVDRALRLRLSRFGRLYQESVLESLRFIDSKGLATVGSFTPELDAVFVDVSLTPRPPHQVPGGLLADPPAIADERRTLASFLDGPAPIRLAIVGGPGSGKTTLLRYTARQVCSRNQSERFRRARVPILLYLRDHAAAICADPQITLTSLTRSTLGRLGSAEPDGWLEQRLRAGDCLVLLDGLDEVARQEGRKKVAAWVEAQIHQFPANGYVVTSRPRGYLTAEVEGAAVLQVRSFTTEQVERFVQGWYLAEKRRSTGSDGMNIAERARAEATDLLKRLDSTPALYELAANPLLLTMITNVHCYRGALPGSRAELYSEICQVMLWRRQEAKQLVNPLPGGRKETVLRALAYAMTEWRVRDLPREELYAEIAHLLRRLPHHIEPDEFVADVVSSGLLVERESGLFAFAHLTFQEYLAAEHIRVEGLVTILCQVIEDPWWHETILLYAARAAADQIIAACLTKGSVTALSLAFDCADQGSEFDSRLRDRLDRILSSKPHPRYPSQAHSDLIIGLQLNRHLHPKIRSADGAHLGSRPVSRDLYRCFQQETHPLSSLAAPWGVLPGTDPAYVIDASDVAAFVHWANSITGGKPGYRLPAVAAVEDPAVQRSLAGVTGRPSVWVQPDSGTTPALWVPPGVRHPQQIRGTDLIACIRDDLSPAMPALLIHLLVLRSAILVRTLDHSTRARSLRPHRSASSDAEVAHDQVLAEELLHQLRLAHELSQGRNRNLGHAHRLAAALRPAMENTIHAIAIVAQICDHLASPLHGAQALPPGLCLEFPPTVAEVCHRLADFPPDYDLDSACGALMGQALSQTLAAVITKPSNADRCASSFPDAFVTAAGITPIDYFAAPGTLMRMLTGAVQTIRKPDHSQANASSRIWADTVAGNLEHAAAPILQHREEVTSRAATLIRLSALCLAAEADTPQPGRHSDRFRRIAAGITLLQRRVEGTDPPAEIILLATD